MQNIYEALSDPASNPELSKHIDPFAGQTAIAMLSKILGLPIAMIDLEPTEFSRIFPKQQVPDLAHGFFSKDRKRYLSWRLLLLDALLLVYRSIVDDDPRDSLIRVCRIRFGKNHANRLYQASSRVSFIDFVKLDRDGAMAIDSRLSKADSANFRASLQTMDMLRDDDLAMALGLLSSAKIGPLPDPSAHTTHQPFQPKLAAFYDTAPTAVRSALPFIYRLACKADVIDPELDIDHLHFAELDLMARLLALEPVAYGFETPSKRRYDRYIAEVCNYIEPGIYKRLKRSSGQVTSVWGQLFGAVKEVLGGNIAARAREVGRAASAQGLLPEQLNPDWFRQQVASMNGLKCNLFRSGCYALDDCRNVDPTLDKLLPPEPTGIQRNKRRRGSGSKKRLPCPKFSRDPVVRAWDDLYVALRQEGYSSNEVRRLNEVRKQAALFSIRPSDLNLETLEKLKIAANITTSFGMAQRLLDDARLCPEMRLLLPDKLLGPLVDKRRTTQDLPAIIDTEVSEICVWLGFGTSSKRAVRVATRTLFEISGMRATSLFDLLALPIEDMDWKQFSSNSKRHIKNLRRIQHITSLPWTDAWKELQAAVVRAGVSSRENPVPALLAYAEGRPPQQLDLRWAKSVDRGLRSLQPRASCGRADLAKTFARNVERLDRLHELKAQLSIELLPSRIGAIRV